MHKFSVIKSIKDGFGLLFRDWKVFMPLILVFTILSLFTNLDMYGFNSGFAYEADSELSTKELIILITCLINWPVYLALNYQMDHSLSNKRVEWWPALKQGLKKSFPVLGAYLIFGFFIFLVLLFADYPGIIYSILYPGLPVEPSTIHMMPAFMSYIIAFIVILFILPLVLLFPLAIVLDNKPFYSSFVYCYKLKKGFVNSLKLYGYISFFTIIGAPLGLGPLLLPGFLLQEFLPLNDVLSMGVAYFAYSIFDSLFFIFIYATNVCLYRNLQQSKQ